MSTFTSQEYNTRILSLQKLLQEKGIEAAVFNHRAELYYYSGSVLPLYCVIPAQGQSFLLARKGSSRILSESTHMPLELFSGSKDLAAIWKKYGLAAVKKIGFILDLSSYSSVSRMLQLSEGSEPVDISWDVRTLRMVKSDAEIVIQKKASEIISKIPEIIQARFKPGMTELELSAHIEFFLRMNGGELLNSKQEGLVLAYGVCSAGLQSLAPNKFDGICSGTGISPALPFGGSDAHIPPQSAIIVDYGFVLNGYHVDMTRMFSHGQPPAEALKAQKVMLEIEYAVLDAIKPGATWESVWDVSLSIARSSGYEEYYMGYGPEKVRFVGHGLGLHLDEPPFLAPKMPYEIKENMVIAIEPKVSLPGIGVVGIEDTVLVTSDGATILTDCPQNFYIL
jgi:Xaa-Pro dipeptidase